MVLSVRNFDIKNRSGLTTREELQYSMEVQEITIATLSGVKPSKTPEMVPNKATSISNVRKAKNSNSSGCSLTNSPYQYFVNNPFRAVKPVGVVMLQKNNPFICFYRVYHYFVCKEIGFIYLT